MNAFTVAVCRLINWYLALPAPASTPAAPTPDGDAVTTWTVDPGTPEDDFDQWADELWGTR